MLALPAITGRPPILRLRLTPDAMSPLRCASPERIPRVQPIGRDVVVPGRLAIHVGPTRVVEVQRAVDRPVVPPGRVCVGHDQERRESMERPGDEEAFRVPGARVVHPEAVELYD